MPEVCLELRDLTLLDAGGLLILQQASARLEAGAKAHLRGPSEGACTALLQACAGLRSPRSGQVLLGGIPFEGFPFRHPWIRRGALAWVPTGGGLLANQTLRANVALPLRFHGRHSKEEADRIAEEWLERWGVADRAASRPHALDPLDRWRASLARASALDADLWLVDRPPETLSPEEAQRIGAHLRSVRGAILTALPLGTSVTPFWCFREGRLQLEDPHAH